MPKLKWVCSYETLKFDTPDGDIHKGEYAIVKGEHWVRAHPENNNNTINLEQSDKYTRQQIEDMISTMAEVHIVPGERMYYDEFELPDLRKYRVPSTEKDYKDLAIKGAKPKEKTVTNAKIIKIKEKDNEWL